jgi:Transcription factor S-II (TFIIS), central domain/SPOC domain/PhD finger domain
MGRLPTVPQADLAVRRSSRTNKGQHSRFGGRRRKLVDVVEDEEGEVRCLCGDNEDDGGFMIQCEGCGKWQHGECMGYENEDEVGDTYSCEVCRPELYKDAEAKEKKVKGKKEKTPEVPFARKNSNLTMQKPKKRKTPPPAEDDSSADDSEFSIDVPLATSKKIKPTPPRPIPTHIEPRKKPSLPPISTARRSSQTRRTSTSITPSTPHHATSTPLACTFDQLPDQKRLPAAKIFANIFRSMDPERAESLGLEIEHALYTAYATSEPSFGAEYKNRFRSISFNLKDSKNSSLRERVLSGTLTPDQLVRLSNEDLANQELKAQAEKIRVEGVAQAVLKVQSGPRIRRTHKGEELVGEDTTVGVMLSPVEGSTSAPFARERSPPSEKALGSPKSGVEGRSRSVSPLQRDETEDTVQGFNISSVWSHLGTPTPEEGEGMELDVLPEDLPENQIDDPDIDRLLADSGGNTPPYSPSHSTFETSQRPLWSGSLSMPSVAQFSAQAHFLGPSIDLAWQKIFPTNMLIDGRIPIDTTKKYLSAQRTSSTKQVVAVRLDPADSTQEAMHGKLFRYFHDRQRYGVLQMHSPMVKDAYLIPLATDEPVPLDILPLDSTIPSPREEQLLLAVLVIHKSLAEHHSPQVQMSPSLPLPSAISPARNVRMSPPTQPIADPIASMGLSNADLAALQAVLVAHPEILANPQILTNPSILQGLIEQHLRAGQQQLW